MRLVFLCLLAAGALAQSGRVEGVVLESASRQPVKKAIVSLRPIIMSSSQNQAPQAITTDATGAFAFEGLLAGQYQLAVTHPDYPQANAGGVHKTVQVSSSETAPSISVELVPGASVSGHIVDEDGDPLNGCFVTLRAAKNPNQGMLMRSTPVQDRDGAYKLYRIVPGKYTTSAQCTARVFQPRPLSEGPDPPASQAYPVQFYPNATDLKSAQVIELVAGSEKSDIDFHMRPVPVTHIHGHIIAGTADWHGRTDLRVSLLPLDRTEARTVALGAAQVQPGDGSFDIRQVFPGSYRLVVISQDFSRPGNIDTHDRVGGFTRVDVADKPLDVSVALQRAVDISGTIEVDQANNTQNPITASKLQVQMTAETSFGAPPPVAQPNDDGSFTIKWVLPGEWRIRAIGPGVFLKSARFGNDDVTNRTFEITSGAGAALQLVVSNNTATIAGTAEAGSVVFAARIDSDDSQRGWTARPVNSNGQFTVPNLAPGKYRVVIGDVGSQMPDEGGQEITVAEGETQTVDFGQGRH